MTGRRGPYRADLLNLFAFLRRRSGGSRNPARCERREPDGRSHALREHASEPRDYEMMVIVTPTVGEEGLPAAVERVSGYITNQGGTVSSTINENPWGRRRLAYQINDHRDAFYVLYRFIARGETVLEIERDIKLDEAIIRYLVVRYDEMTEHVERAPRQQAESPGGPPFRRTRPEGQAAPAGAAPAATDAPAATTTADTPAEEGASTATETVEAPAEDAAPVADAEASQPAATTDEPERPSGEPEAEPE